MNDSFGLQRDVSFLSLMNLEGLKLIETLILNIITPAFAAHGEQLVFCSFCKLSLLEDGSPLLRKISHGFVNDYSLYYQFSDKY